MTRIHVAAAVAVVACLAATAPAHAADARYAKLPSALESVEKVRHIYPRLFRDELARKDGVSWNRLRRAARTAWMRTHPCSDAALNRRYVLGERSWSIVEATWRCSGQSAEWIATRRCIADHEGGRGAPDVRYGGGRGYPGGHGNIVFGHLQIRPGWYRGALEGRRGVYAGDYWTPDLYRFALHPINQARTAEPIGLGHYATAGLCR